MISRQASVLMVGLGLIAVGLTLIWPAAARAGSTAFEIADRLDHTLWNKREVPFEVEGSLLRCELDPVGPNEVVVAALESPAQDAKAAAQPESPGPRAERTVIAELGPEHMANSVYRRGIPNDLAGHPLGPVAPCKVNLQERFGKDALYGEIATSPVLTRADVVVWEWIA